MNLRPRTVGRLPCVKGAVGRRLTEGSAKAFLLNRVLSKHPALSIPPSRLRRATSLYAREASSGGGRLSPFSSVFSSLEKLEKAMECCFFYYFNRI